MVIAAHPDDMEGWCAGTIARAVDQGADVRLLLITAGDKGSNDLIATSEGLAVRREREARDAARALGLTDVECLHEADGEVEDTRTLRGQIVRAIRRWRPSVVFTHDPVHPNPAYLAHRDHRVTGRVAVDAVYPLARDRLTFPEHEAEGLTPHSVSELWLFASTEPDTIVDISRSFERKMSARLLHESQTRDPDWLVRRWRARHAEFGAPVGLALAEGFKWFSLD